MSLNYCVEASPCFPNVDFAAFAWYLVDSWLRVLVFSVCVCVKWWVKFVAGTMSDFYVDRLQDTLEFVWCLAHVGDGDSCEGWCGWLRSWWQYLNLPTTRVSVDGGECILDVLKILSLVRRRRLGSTCCMTSVDGIFLRATAKLRPSPRTRFSVSVSWWLLRLMTVFWLAGAGWRVVRVGV